MVASSLGRWVRIPAAALRAADPKLWTATREIEVEFSASETLEMRAVRNADEVTVTADEAPRWLRRAAGLFGLAAGLRGSTPHTDPVPRRRW